jgi:hypothetical protein
MMNLVEYEDDEDDFAQETVERQLVDSKVSSKNLTIPPIPAYLTSGSTTLEKDHVNEQITSEKYLLMCQKIEEMQGQQPNFFINKVQSSSIYQNNRLLEIHCKEMQVSQYSTRLNRKIFNPSFADEVLVKDNLKEEKPIL